MKRNLLKPMLAFLLVLMGSMNVMALETYDFQDLCMALGKGGPWAVNDGGDAGFTLGTEEAPITMHYLGDYTEQGFSWNGRFAYEYVADRGKFTMRNKSNKKDKNCGMFSWDYAHCFSILNLKDGDKVTITTLAGTTSFVSTNVTAEVSEGDAVASGTAYTISTTEETTRLDIEMASATLISKIEIEPYGVETVPVITVTPKTLKLIPTATAKLTANVSPSMETQWTSSDENIVTVAEDGTVTAIAAGTATITNSWKSEISDATASDACEITVADVDLSNYEKKTIDFTTMGDVTLTLEEEAAGAIFNAANNKNNNVFFCTNEGLENIAVQAAVASNKGWSIVDGQGLFLASGAGRCAAIGGIKANQIVEIIYTGNGFYTKSDGSDDGIRKTALNEGTGRAIYRADFSGMIGFELDKGNAVSQINIYDFKSMTIVGTILGLEATEEDAEPNWNPANGWEMEQDEENSAMWTLTMKNVSLKAGEYEYKATANGNWKDYVLPIGDNRKFTIAEDGEYVLFFSVDTEYNVIYEEVTLCGQIVDIDIYPTGGDIAEALEEAKKKITDVDNKVGDITIHLAVDGDYTVGATLTAPNSIFVYGNEGSVSIDKEMTGDFITLDGTEIFAKKADGTESDHKFIPSVEIRGLNIKGLKGALVKDAQKTLLDSLVIDWSSIEIPATSKNVLDFNGMGFIGKVKVTNSAIWANGMNTGYFAQYGSRPKNVNGDSLQQFIFKDNTIVNIAYGKNVCDLKQNGTAQNVDTLVNNIFVNCGKNGQTVVGFNKGQTSATPEWYVIGNYFEWDGVCTNAAETEKAGQKDGVDIVKDCVEGTLAFADAENGDFNGVFTLAEGATEPKSLGANSYWKITFEAAPVESPYYLVGTMNDWVEDGVKEELRLEKNEEAGEGIEEYMITLDLEADAEFKIVKNGESLVWYPEAENYKVTEAGNYTVYFRPNGDGGDDWFYHVIYLVNNTATGIGFVTTDTQNAVIYNLSGQRVMKAQKGIYIVNGKKVVVKL